MMEFFLKSIFLSSMLQLKKGSQNRQSCKKTNKTNRFFLPKIIKVFLSPILQNLKGRSFFDNFFENGPLDEPRKMPPSKKFYLFRKLDKTQNGDQNRICSSLTLRLQNFPFQKGFKKLKHSIRLIELRKMLIRKQFFDVRFGKKRVAVY